MRVGPVRHWQTPWSPTHFMPISFSSLIQSSPNILNRLNFKNALNEKFLRSPVLRDSWDAMTPPDDEVLAQTCGARGAPIVSRDLCSLIQKFKNCKVFFFSIQMLERASTRFSPKTKTRAGDEACGVGSFILFFEGGYQSCRIELLHNARVKTCPKLRRGKNSKDL